MAPSPPRIGFVGAGQMARALAAGFVQAGKADARDIRAFDPVGVACDAFERTIAGAQIQTSNAELAQQAEIVFLAVKPQQMPAVLADLRAVASDDTLFVSIAAGVSLATLAAGLTAGRLIRVMPNTPCLVGAGASAFACGPKATSEDAARIGDLLSAVGIALPVPEGYLDAVTGLSGSGPAFVYVLIEALADGGVLAGLPRGAAQQLAAQTVLGAAKMVLESDEHPGLLKDRVASPGGTTIAGLGVLEDRGFRAALMRAVQAAADRSRELGQS